MGVELRELLAAEQFVVSQGVNYCLTLNYFLYKRREDNVCSTSGKGD